MAALETMRKRIGMWLVYLSRAVRHRVIVLLDRVKVQIFVNSHSNALGEAAGFTAKRSPEKITCSNAS